VDRSRQREREHVGLPTACALIYAQLTGTTPDPGTLSGVQVLLDDVARALSSVVLVYAQSSDSPLPVAIPPKDLIDGTFSDGAHQFTTRSGKQFHRLTVQRSDMMAAITVFKAAGITFSQHPR
jgi:hypothetical protein